MNAAKKMRKLLIGDFMLAKYKPLENGLRREYIEPVMVADPQKFYRTLQKEPHELCLVNLLLGGIGPHELMNSIKRYSVNPDIKVMIVSRQVQRVNIENCIRAGAVDFVADPFDADVLLQRLLYHLAPKQVVDISGFESQGFINGDWDAVKILVDAIELMSRAPKNQERPAFFKILTDLAKYLGSNRTSLVVIEAEANSGAVYASSDDPAFGDFPLDLKNYPEIVHVANTGNVVLIDDVSRNVMTRKIKDQVKSIEIGSMMVFPIRYHNEIRGVLMVRRPKATDLPPVEVIRVVHALANAMAAHSNVHVMLRKIYRNYHDKAG